VIKVHGRALRFVRVLRPKTEADTKPTPDQWKQQVERAVARVLATAYHDEETVIVESLGLTPAFQDCVNILTRVHRVNGVLFGMKVEPGWLWCGFIVEGTPGSLNPEFVTAIRSRDYPDLPERKPRQ